MDITPEQIYNKLKKSVIGQDRYLKDLSAAAWMHGARYQRYLYTDGEVPGPKQNILCLGPSGSGKTLAVRELGKILDLPVLIEDASALRGAGWKGTNVSSIVAHAVNATPDINEALFCIVCLDEIDKVFRSNSSSGNNQGFLPLDNLLTFLCGGVVTHTQDNNTISLDTSNMLIICLGAFEGLEEIIKKRVVGSGSIGFCAGHKQPPPDPMQSVTEDDLHEYGIPWEFLGRISLITQTKPFTAKDFKNILAESEASPIYQFDSLLYSSLGVHVSISDAAASHLAEDAMRSKTGARNLLRAVAEALHPAIYNLGSCKKARCLVLDFVDGMLSVSKVPAAGISMARQSSPSSLTAAEQNALSSVPFHCMPLRGEICLYAEKMKKAFMEAAPDIGMPGYYISAASCLIASAICSQLSESMDGPVEGPTMASLYQSIGAIQAGKVNNGNKNLDRMRGEFLRKSIDYTGRFEETARVARLMVLEYCHACLQKTGQPESTRTA